MFKCNKIMTPNFKIVEINAYSKEEAIQKAPFQIIRDATQAWKAVGKPLMGAELKDFLANKLQDETKFANGVGCILTVDPGTADTRERPYTVTDIKNEQGKRKLSMAFLVMDKETGEVKGLYVGTTKAEAIEKAKKLYTEKDFKGNLFAQYVKVVTEGEKGAFEITYTPSKSTHLGKYIVFGVEA
jgi:hypothetical protein